MITNPPSLIYFLTVFVLVLSDYMTTVLLLCVWFSVACVYCGSLCIPHDGHWMGNVHIV